jgi:squalene cyclase
MPILYTDTASYADATVLCTDAELTTFATSGTYSINNVYRRWVYWTGYGNTYSYFSSPAFKCPK